MSDGSEKLNKYFKDAGDKMHKTVETIIRELHTVRTGKASSHLLDTVRVEAYGTVMPLNQVATVAAPEPRLLVLTPFDKTLSGVIVKAIQKADLGFNPNVDGPMIRIVIPTLNEERRRELVKHCKHVAEEGRVAVRNIRRDANDHSKKLLKEHAVTEDEEKQALEKMQKLTDGYIQQIDKLVAQKEAEILQV
ncbi:MAG: ribosome recycling factor [candidate division Zixibacteria bacterium]|nr:ribosome recycling factor [candidate division Zixibacteria bacterium]